jgi:hypothetical protein
VIAQALQNAPHFAVLSGSCSETEVSKQLYDFGKKTRWLSYGSALEPEALSVDL